MAYNSVLEMARELQEELVDIRRQLHSYPELGSEMNQTIQYVRAKLEEFGVNYQYSHEIGIIACIEGENTGGCVLLRADMDALPIQEETQIAYRSKLDKRMHACGHDAHMTILLYAAKLFKENLDKLKYNLVLFFQPADEGPLPGGAYYLKNDALLKNIDAFFAYHVSPSLYVGQIGIKLNEACAAPDLWELELTGVGCHASTPERGKNPILAGSEIVMELEKLYQELKKNDLIVVSSTYFNSGVSMNIIRDKAYLKGTARSFKEETRHLLHKKMDDIINRVCQKYGITYKFDFHYAYPPVFNEPKLANMMFKAAGKVLTKENVIELKEPSLLGEDFAYYKEIAPTCLTWIGARNIGATYYDLHNAHFIVPFETIDYGSKILLELVINKNVL